jgi:hypothetical protein
MVVARPGIELPVRDHRGTSGCLVLRIDPSVLQWGRVAVAFRRAAPGDRRVPVRRLVTVAFRYVDTAVRNGTT